ncbi:MAG: cupredoxin family copper-binding protein [Pseudomonadota bacterium]
MTQITRRTLLRAGAAGLIAAPLAARAASHAAPKIVNIEGFAFNPGTVEITAGHGVTFVNMDNAPHTATADNGSFDTGRLGRGQEATLTFQTPGTYTYFCAVHPSMKGTIIVT